MSKTFDILEMFFFFEFTSDLLVNSSITSLQIYSCLRCGWNIFSEELPLSIFCYEEMITGWWMKKRNNLVLCPSVIVQAWSTCFLSEKCNKSIKNFWFSPKAADKLKHCVREKVGRPCIEEDQPGLLETILDLVQFSSATDDGRQEIRDDKNSKISVRPSFRITNSWI